MTFDRRRAGVLLHPTSLPAGDFGADAFRFVDFMQAAGLTPLDVLMAATRNGARALGLGQHEGTVTAGATADLVVLDADPLADIRNVRRVALVVRRGEIYTQRELEYR